MGSEGSLVLAGASALSGDRRFHEKSYGSNVGEGHVCQLLLSQVTGNWETLLIVCRGQKECSWGFDLLTKKRNS